MIATTHKITTLELLRTFLLSPYYSLFYFIYFYLLGMSPLGYLFIALYLLIMFAIVLIKKDTSIGNFTWGGGVLLITLFTFFTAHPMIGIRPRKILITTLICIWALRLIIYLYMRYKPGADPRFVKWAKNWGKLHIFASFIWIVILQGLLMLIMSFPSVMVNSQDLLPLNYLDFVGLIIWLIGFFFEAIGDHQLYTFLKNPNNKGKIMDQGLWRYTRHPNYFGEIAMWWGIYVIALSVSGGWATILAPITITILLLFVTGIPWAESVFKNNPDYEAYKKRTSILIPWFPKK